MGHVCYGSKADHTLPQLPLELRLIKRALRLGDSNRRHAIADQLGQRAGFRHKPIDAHLLGRRPRVQHPSQLCA